MVSAGDADISLHIRPGPILNLGGVGGGGVLYSGETKTQNTLTAKICLNLNFRLGGILGKSKLKVLYVPRSA